MPTDMQSPAKRPQLKDRNSSTVSPSGLQSTSQKGSTTRLHRTYLVGNGKLGHGRVPSTGKNLHKLSKVTAQRQEDSRAQRKAQSPSNSPTSSQIKRNSSNYSLAKAGSKVNIRKNKSDVSIKRHSSGTKSAKGPKSERGQVHFDVGDEEPYMEGNFDQDNPEEEWTEASNSQSPAVTRRSSVTPLRSSNLEEPPSPDDPPARSPPAKLPDSPPRSPVQQGDEFLAREEEQPHKQFPGLTKEHDSQAIQRLLSCGAHQQATPAISSISTLISPPARPEPKQHEKLPSRMHTPSMPSDGISRFLSSDDHPTSNSVSSSSVSRLQPKTNGLNLKDHSVNDDKSPANSSPDPSADTADARKARSAIDLTHHQLTPSTTSQRSTPPDRQQHADRGTAFRHSTRQSPFDGHHTKKEPGLNRSLTQLKLDLERMKSTRDAEAERSIARRLPSPISALDGSALDEVQRQHQQRKEKWAVGERMEERRKKMYESMEREYGNMRRFQDVTVKAVRRLEKRGKVHVTGLSTAKDGSSRRKKNLSQSAPQQEQGSSGSFERADSTYRGRVRFDVGRPRKEDEDRESEVEDEAQEDGVQGILRRMWRDFESTQEVGSGSGE